MQHGRLTEFAGSQCSLQVFRGHVGIRQNIVAWAQNVEWNWPDGKRAQWNKRYWNKGMPLPGVSVSKAVKEAFLNQEKYSIGCYAATKLVMIHGVLDYYARIKKSPTNLAEIERRLMANDSAPLVRIEPRAVWAFEEDFDASELWQKGKLLEMRYNIPARNFVPGDWGYLLNTDPITTKKIGYEGSNAIYLGRGKFDDYYNDHNHSYLFREKLDEVYQWGNKIFSRRRDMDKVHPLTERDIEKLEAIPKKRRTYHGYAGLFLAIITSFSECSLSLKGKGTASLCKGNQHPLNSSLDKGTFSWGTGKNTEMPFCESFKHLAA